MFWVFLLTVLASAALGMECDKYEGYPIIFNVFTKTIPSECMKQFRCKNGYQTGSFPYDEHFEPCENFNPRTLDRVEQLKKKYGDILLREEIYPGEIRLIFEKFQIHWYDEFFRFYLSSYQPFTSETYYLDDEINLSVDFADYVSPLPQKSRKVLELLMDIKTHYSGYRFLLFESTMPWGYVYWDEDEIKVDFYAEHDGKTFVGKTLTFSDTIGFNRLKGSIDSALKIL